MRDINDDDFNGMDGHGRGSSGPLFNKFLSLTPGKGFEVLKKEWHKKYPPTRTANSVMRKYKMVIKWKAIPDGSGWWFLRVK